ncbi:MAG: acyl-CoA thioesterase [Candidatus Thermoplasmatota archaeon]|jgi:acyl-CoA hydrolase|nr:acyl-CoA thioesterase [Candidatus Thermoplasmatota archaeon]MCL5988247.1 acyl-CoA thioesterase [Candidatus Thermoplasmatota archaeon]
MDASGASKTWTDSRTITEKLVLPPDTNVFNSLYGGRLMEWIDNIASIVAFKHCRQRTVTGSIDSIFFLAPIHLGYIVKLDARINYVTSTTMEIEVDVFSQDPSTGRSRFATKAYLTYVGIDQDGRATTITGLKLPDEESKRRFKEAEDRSFRRKDLLTKVRLEAKIYDKSQ